MDAYFKDEVHVALLPNVERRHNDSNQRPGPLLPTDHNDTYPSPAPSPTSSSHTVTGFDSPPQSFQDAFKRDAQHAFQAYDSSETVVSSFISSHFPSLRNKFPTVLGHSDYTRIASDELRHGSRPIASKKKTVCLLLLAALLLGAGGRSIRNAILRAEQAHIDERFHPLLYDEDSFQDASITVPTLPRPNNPSKPEDILPFNLHHSVPDVPPPSAPAVSASNRRQLTTIPSQAHLFDKQQCLDEWITDGTVCDHLDGYFRKRPDLAGIDVLYTWVNGSDWRHSAAKWMHAYRPQGRWQEYVEEDLFPVSSTSQASQTEAASTTLRRRAVMASGNNVATEGKVPTQDQNRFRDHEELRFSMRSAAKHLHGLSSIHIVAPDFSAPYHLQPGAKLPPGPAPTKLRSLMDKAISIIQRRATRPSFMLSVDKLKEGFLGLPSQLRRVQGLGTDRFTTDEGQIREGQVPQWLFASPNSSVLAGQAATRDKAGPMSFSESLLNVFSSLGSTPLDATSPLVRLHHDWNAFTDSWLITKQATAEESRRRDDYRRAALPTFNSMAAESMLGDEPGLHDNFVYSNDDFFFTDDVTTGDFTSPLFGPVMRVDYNLVVAGQRSPASTDGEWSSLWHTNWLLDQRFGKRNRPYIQHVQKSMFKSLLQEARIGWAHEHALLGRNRFRHGGDNIVSHFLAYYNIVERHREALLWSFFMLRLDEDGDGLASKKEMLSALTQMGLTQEQIASAYPEYRQPNGNDTLPERKLTVAVHLPKRKTLAQENYNTALVKAGWPVPLKSRITFTSQDGYPMGDLARKVIFRRDEIKARDEGRSLRSRPGADFSRGKSSYFGWPDFVDERAARPTDDCYNNRFERPACELQLDQCLYQPFQEMAAGPVEWEKVFKFFTYARVQCGDCLIQHLVGQSGERGLSAFLPAADRKYMGATVTDAKLNSGVPHLPLTSVWSEQARTVDAAYETERPCFTVECILVNSGHGKGTSLRTFASKLIQRYSYSFAETPLQFNRLETQYTSTKTLKDVGNLMQKVPSSLELFEERKKEGEVPGAWLASQQNVDLQRPALVCINDDITPRWMDVVGSLFKTWLNENWPDKQPWEL